MTADESSESARGAPFGVLEGPSPEETREFKVAVLGRAGAGKTALVSALCGEGHGEDYRETVGLQVRPLTFPISRGKKTSARVGFWEVGSKYGTKFSYMGPEAKSSAHLVLYVISLADRKGFEALASELSAHEALPTLVVATKQDLAAQVVVTQAEVQRAAHAAGAPIVCVGNPSDTGGVSRPAGEPLAEPVAEVLSKIRELLGV